MTSSMDELARPARIEHEGALFALDEADVARIEARARGMLGSRRSAAYLRARYKYPDLPEPIALALAAASLGVSNLRELLPGAGRALLQPASVTLDGRTWAIEAHELEDIDQALSSGSWSIAAVYPQMKARTASIDAALALTAQLMGMTVEAVRGALEWHDQYMRWHDAEEGYSIF